MAGASPSHADDEEIGGINVTPFVDIALVLLIIFMVTAKYLVQTTIPVDLPQAATGESAQAAQSAVSINPAGRLFLDARPIDDRGLTEEMRRRVSRDRDLRAVISADRTVQHGRVTQVIDLVRQAGVTRFAIQTELPAESAPQGARP